LVSEIVSAI